MKLRIFLALLLISVFTLTACQSGTPTIEPTPETAGETGVEPEGAYPDPTLPAAEAPAAYPEAVQTVEAEITGPTGEALYPGIESGTEVTWDQAVAMIRNGEVAAVAQAHSLRVTLNLEDGRTFEATEPRIDEVFTVIQDCGDVCSDIQVATE